MRNRSAMDWGKEVGSGGEDGPRISVKALEAMEMREEDGRSCTESTPEGNSTPACSRAWRTIWWASSIARASPSSLRNSPSQEESKLPWISSSSRPPPPPSSLRNSPLLEASQLPWISPAQFWTPSSSPISLRAPDRL